MQEALIGGAAIDAVGRLVGIPSQAARMIYGADADPLNEVCPAYLAGPLLDRAAQKLDAERGGSWSW